MMRFGRFFRQHTFGNSRFVELRRLALFDRYRVLRAFAQARPEAVAVGLAEELRFAVDDFKGAFGAGYDTGAAAVAFIFVDFYYFSECFLSHFVSFSALFLNSGQGFRHKPDMAHGLPQVIHLVLLSFIFFAALGVKSGAI
jgi:hypothetical protein